MIAASSARGLVWKEIRQLLPLFVCVVGVGLAVQFFLILASSLSGQRTNDFLTIAWVLPACFAAGAAAVLVGQEKELRTIDWLSALPSQPSRVIAVKFMVAAAGLLIMWIAAALLIAATEFFGLSSSANRPFARGSFTTSPLGLGTPEFFFQSIVILACGFYAAWRTDSVFAGLVLLVPLACGPFLIFHLFTTLYCWTAGVRIVPSGLGTTVLFGLILIWILLFAWLSIRAARQFLSPRPATPSVHSHTARWLDVWRPPVASVPAEPLRYSLSAILWQPTVHRRFALPLFLVLLLAGALGASFMGTNVTGRDQGFFRSAGMFIAIFGALAVSWSGVTTFAGDGSATRLRFLADRGVSPAKVWLGRQLVPSSLISLGVLGYFLFSGWAVVCSDGYNNVMSVALIAASVWTIHVVSQWVGQTVQLLPGALVIAPILSGVVLGWASYTIFFFGAPLWWLLLCSCIPLVVTLALMSRYMDGRRGALEVCVAIALIGTMIVLPVTPGIIKIARHPDISDQQHAQMLAVAEAIEPVQETRYVRFGSYAGESVGFLSSEERVARYQAADFDPSLKPFATGAGDSIRVNSPFSQYDFRQIVQAATHARVAFSAAPEQSEAGSYLVKWINTMIHWGIYLRQSHLLLDQLAADATEIWLVDTLHDDSIRSLAGIDTAAAASLLGDRSTRNQSRRDAVLVSWQRSLGRDITDGSLPTLGHAYTPRISRSSIVWLYTYQKSINLVAAALLDLIDAGVADKPTLQQRQRVAGLVDGIEWKSLHSPYSDYYRQNVSLTDMYTDSARHTLFQVGATWFAPWEDQASQLASSLAIEPIVEREDQE